MSQKRLTGILAVLFALGFSCATWRFAGGEEPVRVFADDLAKGNVVVIGRLGIPLHTVVTVKGIWKPPTDLSKPSGPLFHVTHIDGKAVQEPVAFHDEIVEVTHNLYGILPDEEAEDPQPEEGSIWEFRGYETGAFRGTPRQLEKEMRVPPYGLPVWHRKFLTELKGVMPRGALQTKQAK